MMRRQIGSLHRSNSHPSQSPKPNAHHPTFIESIPYEDVNSDQIRITNHKFRNIHDIENNLTRFQVYPETELACKYKMPIYKTQYSEILVEYENGFDMNRKFNRTPDGHISLTY